MDPAHEAARCRFEAVAVAWSLDIAKIAVRLKHVSLASRQLGKVDFLAWLEDRAVQVGKAAVLGRWQPLSKW